MKSHLSEEQISALVAGEVDETTGRHALECAECAAEVEHTRQALLQFRNSGFQCAEYWEKQPQARPVRYFGRWAAVVASVTAATLAAVILYRPPARQVPPVQEVFLRVPYVVPPAPYERTEVIHMDVPVAALIAAGFKMNMPAADSVSADILLGQDGRPLAVAFPENKQ